MNGDTVLCANLRPAAEAALQTAQSFDIERQHTAAEKAVLVLDVRLAEQLRRVADYRARLQSGAFPASCNSPDLFAFEDRARAYQQNVREATANLAIVKKESEGIKALGASIEKVFRDPNAFYSVHFLGPFDKPTDVTLTFQRKALEVKDAATQALVTAKLNFGGRGRFALSVGVAYSNLNSVAFAASDGFELDRGGNQVQVNGQESFTKIVDRTESSDSRVRPVLIAHTRLTGKSDISRWFDAVHLSLGLTGEVDDAGDDVEFLAGFSLSWAQERFFLTLGAYGGREQELADSLFVGMKVPEGLAEIPTRDPLKWALAVAFSYKLR